MNYQDLINNLTPNRIKSILNKLEIPFVEKPDCLIMPTFCHNHKSEDASHKLYYYFNNKIFMCYTCCGTMSPIKFLKNYYESQQITYDYYNDIYLVLAGGAESIVEGFSKPTYKSLKEKFEGKQSIINLKPYSKTTLDCFTSGFYPVEWLNDRISVEAMKKYDIHYSISQNKIIIPHYDVNGNLVGIRGRALDPYEAENYGKYAPVWIEGKCYSHPLGLNLYGLYYNKNNIKERRICYVGESEKFCLQLEGFSEPNCSVAVCGSQFSKYQLNLLLKYCQPQEIVICFDKEELKGEEKYFNKLYKICRNFSNYCDFSFVYDRKNLTKLKDAPSDCGEEIFRKLIESRVKVK